MTIGWCGIACLLAAPATATATVGGPRSVQVLGYDPVTRAVWYLDLDHSEAQREPQLYRLDLKGRRLSAPRPGPPDERPPDARMRPLVKLDRRLLRLSARPRCKGSRRVDDTVLHARCRVRVTLRGRRVARRTLVVTTYRKPDVTIAAAFRVPKTRYLLVILEYIGIPIEFAYAVQQPVLLRVRS